MSDRRAESSVGMPQPEMAAGRVLSNRVIAVSAVLMLLLSGGLAWILLSRFGDGSAASNAQLDGIRTVGTIVLGAGGAIALLLAARRQQTAEQDLAHKRRVQAHVESDATERLVTELYDKAVEKLGSEKAAVRFGGLYALERLAQHTPNQQAAVSKVLCAYLRMPYLPPGDDPGLECGEESRLRYERRREERDVRFAVQQVLANHLRFGDDACGPAATYWSEVEIDLSGAALIDLNFNRCTLPCDAAFRGATFIGSAAFVGTTFCGNATFDDAKFMQHATFHSAFFVNDATFGLATFSSFASFNNSTFVGIGGFDRTNFNESAEFIDAIFYGDIYFLGTVFAGRGRFDGVVFDGRVEFNDATFIDDLVFSETVMRDKDCRQLDFSGSIVRLDVPDEVLKRRQWPASWSVSSLGSGELAEDLEGSWGVLVRQ